MLNEEKIRLMTDLALFEKKNGSQMKTVTSYFKSDYISRNLIRGFISFTICSVMLLIFWVLFHMDIFLSAGSLEALAALAARSAAIYVLGLLVYLAVMGMVYGKRYDDEVRMNRIYLAKLKHLDKRYDYHSRSRALAREGRRV